MPDAAPKHQPTKRVGQDIARLARSKRRRCRRTKRHRAELTTTRKGTTTQQRLEQRKAACWSHLRVLEDDQPAGLERDTTYSSGTDMLGRRTTDARTQTTRELANGTDTRTSAKGTDAFGVVKHATERSADLSLDNGTLHQESRLARDSRGNRITSSAETRVEQQGKSVVTTNAARAKGSELTTRSGTTWEDRVFRLSDGADWKKTNSFERGYLKDPRTTPRRWSRRPTSTATRWTRCWVGWTSTPPSTRAKSPPTACTRWPGTRRQLVRRRALRRVRRPVRGLRRQSGRRHLHRAATAGGTRTPRAR